MYNRYLSDQIILMERDFWEKSTRKSLCGDPGSAKLSSYCCREEMAFLLQHPSSGALDAGVQKLSTIVIAFDPFKYLSSFDLYSTTARFFVIFFAGQS